MRKVMFFLLVFGTWTASALTSPEYSCFAALETYTAGPYQADLTGSIGEKSVLFSGLHQAANEPSKPGLFFLFENAQCFAEFPDQPATGGEEYYRMKMVIAGLTPFYLGLQLIPGEYPALTYSPAPLPGGPYVNSPCANANDTTGEQAVADFLAAKIRTMPDRYSWDLTGCSSLRNCRPKQEYLAALNSCTLSSLQPVINQAVQNLQGLPECGCPAN